MEGYIIRIVTFHIINTSQSPSYAYTFYKTTTCGNKNILFIY